MKSALRRLTKDIEDRGSKRIEKVGCPLACPCLGIVEGAPFSGWLLSGLTDERLTDLKALHRVF
jgi:hypothetical protein